MTLDRNRRFSLLLLFLLGTLAAALPLRADERAGGFVREWTFEPADLVPGVFGTARTFPTPTPEKVEMSFLPESGTLERFSVSAWIRPRQYEQYNEIFRQECEERILFSLQEQATILSLGLNIGGYQECDAPINRGALFDGDWHFVAGTFDGQTMRVWLDGREIHQLDRPGRIAVNRSAPGFIGSFNGTSELFQGEMDNLRLSGETLTATEIEELYRQGQASLERQNEPLVRELARFYRKKADLIESLLATRKAFVAYRQQPASAGFDTKTLLVGLDRRLKLDFPKETKRYLELIGQPPSRLVSAENFADLKSQADRPVRLMLEYMPLTPEQWAFLTPEEKKQWAEVEAVRRRYESLKFEETAESLRPLLSVLETAKKTVRDRPTVREPVAPYVVPQTPEPKTYDEEQAQTLLRRDWLEQCGGPPSAERILQEIDWAVRLGERITTDPQTGSRCDSAFFASSLKKLNALRNAAKVLQTSPGVSSEELEQLYYDVREVKRAMQFANPLVDFRKVLFIDMPYPGGSEWQHETRHRLGYMAVPGAQILELDGLKPNGKLRRLMPQEPLHGSFWRFDLSFDARRVLMCFKPHNEKSFHIYEIGLDGTGLRQLTAGPFDDLDPIYLPDGENYAFSTTRGYTYVRCMPPTNAFVLGRASLKGDDVYLISQNNEPDYLPAMLDDGRLIYTRWEYTDKPLWRCQSLWTTNPDGTQHNAFWGNQSVWPDLLKDARQIPGTRRIMFTGSAHHDWFAGSVGIIDPDKGLNFPDGLTKVTADVPWPETGNGPVDPIESPTYHASGEFRAYHSPYPLGEFDFLVSANKDGKFRLYLMDVDGNRELIYEGVNNVLHAIPVRPRPRPPVLADRINWPSRAERDNPPPGSIYSGNVYYNAPEELRGKAKYLRVLNIEPKTYTYWDHRPYISTGPVVSVVQSEGVKRILGTVPIEKDGSVRFEAPSGVALHFQLLDENHRALQTMRSFTGVMPGESRGCLGCHESHSRAPESTVARYKAVFDKEQRRIMPVPWAFNPEFEALAGSTIEQAIEQAVAESALGSAKGRNISEERWRFVARNGTAIGYTRDIRPVLDRYCAECHTGDAEGKKAFDITPRAGFLDFDQTYITLTGSPAWGTKYVAPDNPPPGFGYADMLHVEGYGLTDPAAYTTPRPMSSMSYVSRLVKLCADGEHYRVKLDPVSLLKVILWVDAMCPYLDETDIRAMPDPVFQGSDWLSVPPRLKTAPRIVRPGPFSARQEPLAPEPGEND